MIRDHDYRLGEDAALRGAPLPSEGYSGSYNAQRHWQRVRGYEQGERLRRSPEFRAGFARGVAAVNATSDKTALQHATLLSVRADDADANLEFTGYFYAVFNGELGAE